MGSTHTTKQIDELRGNKELFLSPDAVYDLVRNLTQEVYNGSEEAFFIDQRYKDIKELYKVATMARLSSLNRRKWTIWLRPPLDSDPPDAIWADFYEGRQVYRVEVVDVTQRNPKPKSLEDEIIDKITNYLPHKGTWLLVFADRNISGLNIPAIQNKLRKNPNPNISRIFTVFNSSPARPFQLHLGELYPGNQACSYSEEELRLRSGQKPVLKIRISN